MRLTAVKGWQAEKRSTWSTALDVGFSKWQPFPIKFPIRSIELKVKLGVRRLICLLLYLVGNNFRLDGNMRKKLLQKQV